MAPNGSGVLSQRDFYGTPLPDAGQPRPFVSKQKDAKIAFPTYILAASEIASDFHAAAPVEQQILGLSLIHI